MVRIHLGDDQPAELLTAGEFIKPGADLIQHEPGEVREVRQREQPGVQHVHVQVHQVGLRPALQVRASRPGLPGGVGPHRRGRSRVQVSADQLGPLPGVQFGRVEPEHHHLLRSQQRATGAQPGQPRRAAAEQVSHAHRVGHPGFAAFRGAKVRVAVEVHQPGLVESGQHAERDRAVAAEHERQPSVGPDRGHLARDLLGHGDDPLHVPQPVDRRHRPERRRGQVTPVLDVQPGLAQPVGQPGGTPRGRGLFLAGIMRTRATRHPENAHSPALLRHSIRLQDKVTQ